MTRLRVVMLGLAVFLPVLTLIPLGSLWLWQNGLLLYWVAGALAATGLFYGLEAWILPSKRIKPSRAGSNAVDPGEPHTEAAAQAAVIQLADSVDPSAIKSRADVAALAARTIEAVAHELHPNDKTPVWNFTIPEILLLTERVSARLRPVVIDTIPLGEHLTVGQALRLYEWRSAVGVAEKIYDVWRLLRIFNPVAAATQEARERITKQIVASVRDDLTKRILRVFVMEVGTAAIDLYAGRLNDEPASVVNLEGSGVLAARAPEPLNPPSRFARVWREAKKVTKTASSLYGRKSGGR